MKDDFLKKLLQRLDEVGMKQFEQEALAKYSPIADDFKKLTDKVKKICEEEQQQEDYISSGKPILTFTVKL